MADVPTPGLGSSLFAGNERIPKSSFYGYLFTGIAVDVLAFWLPGAGDVYIVFCRGMYWLNSYKTDKMMTATVVDAAIEAIPVLSALPSATAFAIWTYAINVAETNKLGAMAATGAKMQTGKGGETGPAANDNVPGKKTEAGAHTPREHPERGNSNPREEPRNQNAGGMDGIRRLGDLKNTASTDGTKKPPGESQQPQQQAPQPMNGGDEEEYREAA